MALLAAVFAVSLAVGYFLAQVIVRPDVKAEKEVVSYQYEDQDAESVYETIDSTEYYDSLILALEAEEAAAAQAAVEAAAEEVTAEEVVEPVKYRLFTKSMMQDFLDQKDWELRPTDSKELFPQWMKIECVGLDYAKDEFEYMVEYYYDAWGNCTIDSSTTNTTLARANPIRYRGYYYDEDTKLYYLNATTASTADIKEIINI